MDIRGGGGETRRDACVPPWKCLFVASARWCCRWLKRWLGPFEMAVYPREADFFLSSKAILNSFSLCIGLVPEVLYATSFCCGSINWLCDGCKEGGGMGKDESGARRGGGHGGEEPGSGKEERNSKWPSMIRKNQPHQNLME